MQKLSLVSILMLIALTGVGFFIVAVYNPFNSNTNNLQSPILNSNNPHPGASATVTTVTSVTSVSTSSATASSTSGNSPSGGVSLLTGSPSNNTSASSGGDDGGSDS